MKWYYLEVVGLVINATTFIYVSGYYQFQLFEYHVFAENNCYFRFSLLHLFPLALNYDFVLCCTYYLCGILVLKHWFNKELWKYLLDYFTLVVYLRCLKPKQSSDKIIPHTVINGEKHPLCQVRSETSNFLFPVAWSWPTLYTLNFLRSYWLLIFSDCGDWCSFWYRGQRCHSRQQFLWAKTLFLEFLPGKSLPVWYTSPCQALIHDDTV